MRKLNFSRYRPAPIGDDDLDVFVPLTSIGKPFESSYQSMLVCSKY